MTPAPATESVVVPEPASPSRRFWPWLTVWTLVGFGIRLGTVLGRPNRAPGGDPGYAHGVATLVVAGKGFINPYAYNYHNQHHILQTAGWPPLWTFLLTVPIVFGFHTFFAARIWSCIIGAATIVICGLAGREIAGRRVGLITALVIAVYPNIWLNVELASSEVLSPLLVGLILWTAYRFWRTPSMWNVAAFGVSVGLGALGRDELSLLMLFIFVPLVLIARSVDWRRRMALLLVGAAVAGVVVFPWVGYNLSRFDRVVTISDGLGSTLLSANCNVTYSGAYEGYWSWLCVEQAAGSLHNSIGVLNVYPNRDESVTMAEDQSVGMHYIRAHASELPAVTLARIGRGFGFFHPMQQVQFDSVIETRPYGWAKVGLGMYYALLALSIGGSVILRRRRVPIFPLWAVALDALLVFVVGFGNTRYRVTFEVPLAILASVQLEWLWATLVGRFRRRGTRTVEDDGDPSSALSGSEGMSDVGEQGQLIGGGREVRG